MTHFGLLAHLATGASTRDAGRCWPAPLAPDRQYLKTRQQFDMTLAAHLTAVFPAGDTDVR